MSRRLEGKVAIITGGSRGMGEATVRKFVEEGAKVLIGDVQDEAGQALAKELGAAVRYCHLDIADEAAWQAALKMAEDAFGPVTALVNNAAINAFRSILDIDKATFMNVLEVNLGGTFLGVKIVGGAMVRRRKGAIVNISSVDGMRGANTLSAYISSKWGVRGLTKAAAMEFGPRGVRVNSIHPGGVYTAMGNPTGQSLEETNKAYGMVPLQRIGMPNEVAQASAFLVSDEASYIHGAELTVDGGWVAGVYHAGLPGAPDDVDYGKPGVEHAAGKYLDAAFQAHNRR
jgi:3alpha(or 20beta)-hydroxysteroid dehydrogenase